jgi:hypothetical protein
MSDPYIRLWQAVIQQQFADMRNQNKKEDCEILRSQARHWLLEDHRDFSTVCDLAGWHPEKVRAYAQQMSKM